MLGGEGQEGQVSRALQSDCQHPLVARAGARLASRLDLATVGDVAAQPCRLLVVDRLHFIDAEDADAPAAEATAAAAGRRGRGVAGR